MKLITGTFGITKPLDFFLSRIPKDSGFIMKLSEGKTPVNFYNPDYIPEARFKNYLNIEVPENLYFRRHLTEASLFLSSKPFLKGIPKWKDSNFYFHFESKDRTDILLRFLKFTDFESLDVSRNDPNGIYSLHFKFETKSGVFYGFVDIYNSEFRKVHCGEFRHGTCSLVDLTDIFKDATIDQHGIHLKNELGFTEYHFIPLLEAIWQEYTRQNVKLFVDV